MNTINKVQKPERLASNVEGIIKVASAKIRDHKSIEVGNGK